MSSIQKSNIEGYLRFLNQYLENSFDAETIQKWTQLSDTDLPKYLQKLYSSQGISPELAATMEQDYLRELERMKRSHTATITQPVQDTIVSELIPSSEPKRAQPQKRNRTIPILLLLLVIAGGIAAYPYIDDYLRERYQRQNTPVVSQTEDVSTYDFETETTIDSLAEIPDDIPEIIDEVATTTVPQEAASDTREATQELTTNHIAEEVSASPSASFSKDKAISNLASLIIAEDNHNTSQAISYYSPNVSQYWDMQRPSKAQLRDRYNKAFSKLAESQNEVISSEWVGPKTLEALLKFSYTGANTGETKTIYTRMRYKFDDNGLIEYANKVK